MLLEETENDELLLQELRTMENLKIINLESGGSIKTNTLESILPSA